eukprot:INCI6954.1.p1 GENE.INCI6954.1~~INCI6954.1.p1  ORF type:complete len:386 (-),score=108.80 INCI6954.1:68-1225(-)
MAHFHNKIARAVHASPVSEEYDLHGYTQEQCEQLGTEIFAHRFKVKEQFRISFIIGGGKEVRQKYDANLPKWLTEVLRQHGFEDDIGASAVNECQKKYKYQDDTGKNVKRLHVFPDSEIIDDGSENAGSGKETNEEKLIRSTAEEFPAMLNERVPTWLQLRRAQHVLTTFGEKLEQIEAKMIKCEALSEAEAELYHADHADKELVQKKLKIIATKMKAKVAAGDLTPAEKEHLIAHAEERLAELEESVGGEEGGEKQVPAGAAEAIEKVKQRIEKLKAVKAQERPLRHADEIFQTWKKMKPLQEHDVSGPHKRAALDQLPVLEEKVKELAAASKEWFETEEELQERLDDLHHVFKGQTKKKARGGGGKKQKGMSKKAQLRAARGI